MPLHKGSIPVSVLIPTRDEERNIRQCIESVSWASEIIVFDSHSEDKTTAIATSLGAKVVQRTFDNFSDHKNWALENIKFAYPWVFLLDADERVHKALAYEIRDILTNLPKHNGYYVARRNFFMGRWIRHGGWYPDWQLRLFRIGKARYEQRIVHEHMLLAGDPGYLMNALIHEDYKGIERYIDRHNTYSSLEAVEIFKTRNKTDGPRTQIDASLLSKGPERRRFLKNLAYRYLPFRPIFKFLWMYFWRLGFLDGKAGLRFCILHMIYDYQITLKLEELEKPNSPIRTKHLRYLE